MQLNEDEKNIILKKFEDSPVVNPQLIGGMTNKELIPHELRLEAEIVTEEINKLILKDFGKGRKNFDWEIFW